MSALPEGPLPYGYAVVSGYPIERTGQRGLEVTIAYAGPWEKRWAFLGELFGFWKVDYGGECCCELLAPPRHYTIWNEEVDEVESEVYYQVGTGIYEHLYPDTWDIKMLSDQDITYLDLTPPEEGEEDEDTPAEKLERPMECECPAVITVQFRSKYTTWPKWMRYNCIVTDGSHEDCTAYPEIPTGTFVEVEASNETEIQTIPGRLLTYDTEEPNWPDGVEALLPEDVNFGYQVATTRFQVRWTNVPLVPTANIMAARSKLNATPMLGFPSDSVLLAGYEIIPQIPWYGGNSGVELYTIEYDFVAATVQGYQNITTTEKCFEQMGYWNRRWTQYPIDEQVSQMPDGSPIYEWDANTVYNVGNYVYHENKIYVCLTNTNLGDPPPPSAKWDFVRDFTKAHFRKIISLATGEPVYGSANFDGLFYIPICEA